MNVDTDILNALIVLVFALVAAFGGGGVWAFIAMLKQHQKSLEAAFKALPPEAMSAFQKIAEVLAQVSQLLSDIVEEEAEDDSAGEG